MANKLMMRGYAFSMVINDNELHLFKSEKHIMDKILKSDLDVKFIAVILHDCDTDEYDHKKTNHYHLVISLRFNCTIGSIIKKLVEIFHCNENQISCEKCNDLCAQVRYMIHLDDRDKYQYMPFDVVTNNQLLVAEYFSKEVSINDTTDVDAICDRFHFDLRKIAKCMGDNQFKKWLWYIQATKRDLYR